MYLLMTAIHKSQEGMPLYRRYAGPVLWSLWTGIWILSGYQAFRSRGDKRTAVAGVTVLTGGVVLASGLLLMARKP
jgi:hypothetical protein